MPKPSFAAKQAYVQQTRMANYNASLWLEGNAPSVAPALKPGELVAAKNALLTKDMQKK